MQVLIQYIFMWVSFCVVVFESSSKWHIYEQAPITFRLLCHNIIVRSWSKMFSAHASADASPNSSGRRPRGYVHWLALPGRRGWSARARGCGGGGALNKARRMGGPRGGADRLAGVLGRGRGVAHFTASPGARAGRRAAPTLWPWTAKGGRRRGLVDFGGECGCAPFFLFQRVGGAQRSAPTFA